MRIKILDTSHAIMMEMILTVKHNQLIISENLISLDWRNFGTVFPQLQNNSLAWLYHTLNLQQINNIWFSYLVTTSKIQMLYIKSLLSDI